MDERNPKGVGRKDVTKVRREAGMHIQGRKASWQESFKESLKRDDETRGTNGGIEGPNQSGQRNEDRVARLLRRLGSSLG